MNKTKIIAIAGGIFILLLAVIFSAMGSISKNRMGSRNSSYGLSAPMGTGLPSSSMGDILSFEDDSGEDAVASKSVLEESMQSVDSPVASDKKVIKNGNLTLKVDEVDEAVESISEIAKANGGDIFSSNFYKNSQDQKSGTLTVKVPVNNFEKTFSETKKVAAAVVRESTSGQDVTEQYQDIEGQIKNKKAEEEAYQKILSQASKTSDIIEVTQALSRVRGEIERLQGRLRYLASQTDMATITVSLSEDANIAVSDSWRPLQIAKEAVRSLIVKIQNFISFLIIFVIIFIPVAIIYLVVFWIVYKIGKTIYKKMFKKEEKKVQA